MIILSILHLINPPSSFPTYSVGESPKNWPVTIIIFILSRPWQVKQKLPQNYSVNRVGYNRPWVMGWAASEMLLLHRSDDTFQHH